MKAWMPKDHQLVHFFLILGGLTIFVGLFVHWILLFQPLPFGWIEAMH